MQIPKMKVLAEAGAVREVDAMPEADGWAVWITYTRHGGERREVLERQRSGIRVFATLEAVVHCVAAAGLAEFRVQVRPP
ncbi:MAG: hypothetical protein JNJ76_08180 [Candidatus Competibacter sp.]|nr:hypothetical protein [Candidatus Competibacter sp.]